jgi:hypothetical protein
MTEHRTFSGSRYLYAPFDAADAKIEANERVQAERWSALAFRLEGIEHALQRLEKRLWLAVFGVVSVILAQGINELLNLNIGG